MKKSLAVLFSLLASAAILAACGQTGPLYLPGAPSTLTTPVPEQQPVPVEETSEETEDESEEEPKPQTDNPA